MSVVRIPAAVWDQVHHHLYSTPGEHFAFLRARWGEGRSGPVFLVHDALLVPDDDVQFTGVDYEIGVEGVVRVVNEVVGSPDALIEVHNHGGAHPRFSLTDRQQLPGFVDYMLRSLPGRPYAATVWGDDTVYGEWFGEDGGTGRFSSVTVLGENLRPVLSTDVPGVSAEPNFSRQAPWFTGEGQSRLGRLRVAIVGAGGTGSLVLQQLAYLGVRDFVVIDPDSIEESNLNRLVTAVRADLGTLKAVAARRLIRSIVPEASVQIETEGVPSQASLRHLAEADVIFGCLDHDGPRYVLNSVARAYGIPYFDLATGITAAGGSVSVAGGRLVVALSGGPCLHCVGELDLEEVRHWLKPPGERIFAEERGYVRGLNVRAPSVISINGVMAAIAVNEFAVLVSGVRQINHVTDFDLLGRAREFSGQWVTPRRVGLVPECPECNIKGTCGEADIDRFWRRRL